MFFVNARLLLIGPNKQKREEINLGSLKKNRSRSRSRGSLMKYYDGHRFLSHIRNYIEQIGIYLKNHFFTHGQLSMSRVGSKERLKILTE